MQLSLGSVAGGSGIFEGTRLINDDPERTEGSSGRLGAFFVKHIRTLVGTVALVSLVVTAYLLYLVTSSGNSSYQTLENILCYLGLGLFSRMFAEANLNAKTKEMVDSFLVSLSWQSLLILYTLQINLDYDVFMDTVVALSGWYVTGSITTVIQLRREEGDQSLDFLLHEKASNKMVVPDFKNWKGRVAVEVGMTIYGIAGSILGYLYPQATVLTPIFTSFSNFLCSKGPGRGIAEGLIWYWKRGEIQHSDVDEVRGSTTHINPQPSALRGLVGTGLYILPHAAPYLLVVPLLFPRPESFFALGFIYGMTQAIEQRKLQTITQDSWAERKKRNTYVDPSLENPLQYRIFTFLSSKLHLSCIEHLSYVKTSALVNGVTTPLFLMIANGFAIAVIIMDPDEDKYAMGTAIGSGIAYLGVHILSNVLFKPEADSRCFGIFDRIVNHAKYLTNNPYLLPVVYFSTQTVTGITDRAIQADTNLQYRVALVGWGFYGALIMKVGIDSMDRRKIEGHLVPPYYLMQAIKSIADVANGTL